ncbi:tRNA (5-methylaminomethyl-2-thiouridine)(34)-methyltransferase MnmD [Marivibrio halodurans]|uniref:tRNA 5-methylaminomethyl-2-thiouridine biosynthesis bifunctional protein MnmC n=1 Tax=Marivibrio halodurans TaxID=2039722 RepID=A0A8J7RYL9_9PROT|nr:tRNA (5-methylaminomethyl-2-thiouridine)(34)-methyltransferase MnmD [Marivibrio halodurans]MBP5855508.1 tRNA (5-methylaminomethyl-2-thiouridine)(34)-methyltransferase MnmD [Marivibrio halodurans]
MSRSAPTDPRVPHPGLTWDDNGIPRAEGFGDAYFDGADPVGERRHVFLEGCGLPEAWTGRERFTVGETGFGTGLSVLLLIDAWRKTRNRRPAGALLDILSVEGYPLDGPDLARAHRLLPEDLATDAAELRAQWPPPYRGPHRIAFPEAGVRLTLMLDEAAAGLSRMEAAADAWFLDGFAPAANPDMWTETVIGQVTRLCAPGARLASFTAAGAVRRALQQAGAQVTRRPGFGRKRHCLMARFPEGDGTAPSRPGTPAPAPRRAPWHQRPTARPGGTAMLVVGDGIAARCCAHALAEYGMAVTRIAPRTPDGGAVPHPPAILLAPKLVRGGDAYARLSALAYLDALRRYETIAAEKPGLWLARGVSEPARAGKTDWRGRHAALVDALDWPESLLTHDGKDLHHPRAGVIDPAVLHDWLDTRTAALGGATIAATVTRLDRHNGLWRALDADGEAVTSAPVAILAAGPWSLDLLPESDIRGVARHAGGRLFLVPGSDLAHAVNRVGFLTQPLGAQYGERAVLGASARPGATPDDALAAESGLHDESLRMCLDRIAMSRPDTAARIADAFSGAVPESWTGVRATTPDHLPMAGPVPDDRAYRRSLRGLARGARGVRRDSPPDGDETKITAWDRPGLFTVAMLGARGYQLAPLLADMLAAELTGGVSPLTAEDMAALHPGRFLIRAMARE